MNGEWLLGAVDWNAWLKSPPAIGLGLLAVGLIVALPVTRRVRQRIGWLVAAVGLGVIAGGSLVESGAAVDRVMFWVLAAVAVVGSVAAITMTSAVYAAIWFAFSLLGVASLMWFQGAEFLGVATLVVYAGAIVVTLLFVLMLAQPRGDIVYDRLSWGDLPRVISPLLAIGLVAMLTAVLPTAVSPLVPVSQGAGEAVSGDSVAALGAFLFTRHLVGVELAGTLLLAALVGAVSIAMHGRQSALGQQSALGRQSASAEEMG